MKQFRVVVIALAVAFGIHSAAARAQVPASTPAPNPYTYDDPAMHFEVPHDYLLVGKREVDSKTLEGPTQVAVWVKNPGKTEQRTITISLEPYDGRDVKAYEVNVENSLREKIDGVFISGKQQTALSNGMPAYFMIVSAGSGFDSHKLYQYVWCDGLRGVQISIGAALGQLNESDAKEALKDATGVLYPFGRL